MNPSLKFQKRKSKIWKKIWQQNMAAVPCYELFIADVSQLFCRMLEIFPDRREPL